jgi:hypothetical protein
MGDSRRIFLKKLAVVPFLGPIVGRAIEEEPAAEVAPAPQPEFKWFEHRTNWLKPRKFIIRSVNPPKWAGSGDFDKVQTTDMGILAAAATAFSDKAGGEPGTHLLRSVECGRFSADLAPDSLVGALCEVWDKRHGRYKGIVMVTGVQPCSRNVVAALNMKVVSNPADKNEIVPDLEFGDFCYVIGSAYSEATAVAVFADGTPWTPAEDKRRKNG